MLPIAAKEEFVFSSFSFFLMWPEEMINPWGLLPTNRHRQCESLCINESLA
ncbi:hypothetical protein [Vibrio vulnificus YJ016]|uniref:Uncharacterized protein n=1 Tax=Vibrio vulnificus (strain YJ016) TaxID=196600 RepID=Q7MLD6_VIBVY|nr:hypothetical protein [Vibrio vulnificus YJ016]